MEQLYEAESTDALLLIDASNGSLLKNDTLVNLFSQQQQKSLENKSTGVIIYYSIFARTVYHFLNLNGSETILRVWPTRYTKNVIIIIDLFNIGCYL